MFKRTFEKFVLPMHLIVLSILLQRLTALFDPTSPVLRSLLVSCRAHDRTTPLSSESSQFDSLDLSESLYNLLLNLCNSLIIRPEDYGLYFCMNIYVQYTKKILIPG